MHSQAFDDWRTPKQEETSRLARTLEDQADSKHIASRVHHIFKFELTRLVYSNQGGSMEGWHQTSKPHMAKIPYSPTNNYYSNNSKNDQN
eukprot:50052-Amphidinium_carterae.1